MRGFPSAAVIEDVLEQSNPQKARLVYHTLTVKRATAQIHTEYPCTVVRLLTDIMLKPISSARQLPPHTSQKGTRRHNRERRSTLGMEATTARPCRGYRGRRARAGRRRQGSGQSDDCYGTSPPL